MADGDKTVRSTGGTRGGVQRSTGGMIGSVAANAAAPVIDLLARVSEDELALSVRSRDVLAPALEARGYELQDARLPYNDKSPRATLVAGTTPFCLMHIHPDLLPESPAQQLPHDFSHLGFCIWRHGIRTLRILSEDMEYLPVQFESWFRTWQDTVKVEARFVGWSRVEALRDAEDPAEALPLYLSLDLSAAPTDDERTAEGGEQAEVLPLHGAPDRPPPGVFISYSHADDEKWIDELRRYVKEPLGRLQYEVWDDGDIDPGDRWREGIDAALARATIVLLMVSQNFENSQFIQENELRPALEAAEGGVKVFAVAVSRVAWQVDPLHSLLGGYQWAYGPPTDDTPPLDELEPVALRKTLVEIRIAVQRELEESDDPESSGGT